MATVPITGTSRGLGLALTKLFSLSPSTSHVIATARSPSPPAALSEVINSSNNKVKYIPLDVDSLDNIKQAVEAVSAHLPASKGLDILINNAGISIYEPNFLTPEILTQTLNTNVIAIHNIISAFLPFLRAGSAKKIMNISSTVGSIAMADIFAFAPVPSYKISKAALNMLNACYARELGKEGFTCTVISPGWLRTDLGGESADLSVDEGAQATLNVIEGVTAEKDNGAFRNISVEGSKTYDGKNPPW